MMARPKSNQAPDLALRANLTVGAIERLRCPTGKQQAFLRDSEVPGLRVRVTAAGAKSFVFEAKLHRKTIRRTLGDVRTWSIEQARTEARRQAVVLDGGQDPRELERQRLAKEAAALAAATAQGATVSQAWAAYLDARRKDWGERHYEAHLLLVKPGGVPTNRLASGMTTPGLLHPLMAMPLRDLTAPVIEAWTAREAAVRPAAASLAWRCLKAFLNWCAEQTDYKIVLPSVNPANTKATRRSLGKPGVKQDALLKEQLPAWFGAVQHLPNPLIAAYLQTLLLTGARAGEVLGLRWEDINTKWRGLTIRDKVEGTRVIPLTPYVWHLLNALPRTSEFVFASATAAGGTLVIPRNPHHDACRVAGIDGLTIHGLRRSFKSLTEWLDIPAGVVAQLMGHKPSGTAEKHYTFRPLDLLRLHHEKIEAWILMEAGVAFEPALRAGGLRIVSKTIKSDEQGGRA